MQQGQIVFPKMERLVFGMPAAQGVLALAERRDAHRVFLLVSGTLNRNTDEVRRIAETLGDRFAGAHDDMPAHSPRDAVVACANAMREAGADLLVTFGGGSVTDGGKVVTLCLKHGIADVDGLEPFRSWVDGNGKRHFPHFAGPDVRQVAIPTTLSAGEFNARAGVTDNRLNLKQSYVHPGIIPAEVILDPAVTVHTPEWLFLSSGIRAVDHAVETYLSVNTNDYAEGMALQALRLLCDALPQVKRNPDDLKARLRCQLGSWMSLSGVMSGARMGASHAIGHILGGTAGVPHGYTSCVMLPYVLAWNAAVNGKRQADIAAALGRSDASGAEALDAFIASLGMPRRLRDVGVNREQLPILAENCMLDDATFTNPRRIAGKADVLNILESAF